MTGTMPADGKSAYDKKLSHFAKVICGADTISICGHINPDGDCIGSMLALASALRTLGKRVTPTLAQDKPAPRAYRFLEGFESLTPAIKHKSVDDLCISVDVSNRERMGEGASILSRAHASIAIDHHPDTEVGADETLSDPTKASASMIVWDLAVLLLEKPPRATAQACYVGLMTDTGRFQFQNADADAFSHAAAFVASGADPAQAGTAVYQNKSMGLLKLEGLLIDRIVLSERGKVALSWFETSEMRTLGVASDETEALPETIRSVEGTEVIILLRGDGQHTRGNLRSKGTFDVSALAAHYGGGGHRAASGMMISKPIDKSLAAIEKILPALEADLLAGRTAPTFFEGDAD